MNAYSNAIRNYFNFSGRASRSEYWLFVLFYSLILVAAMILDAMMGGLDEEGLGIVSAVVVLFHFIPSLSILFRRLHDIDRSAWWLLIAFVPLIGSIVLLVFACTASTPRSNRFGPHPAGRSTEAAPAYQPATGFGRMTPTAAAGDIPIEKLEKLSALRAAGSITEEEFAAMKGKLLSGTA